MITELKALNGLEEPLKNYNCEIEDNEGQSMKHTWEKAAS
jgi:hypothetical protein